MELNREQIIKALECCTVGIGTECEKCPYMRTAYCNDVLKKDILCYIKELTEDNEYLKTQLTATEARAESRKESDIAEILELRTKVEELTEENERLKAAGFETVDYAIDKIRETRADTVRIMREKMKEAFKHHTYNCRGCIIGKVDQIAKEMLENYGEN